MKIELGAKVVLDACVLYPAPIRDLLLSLAAVGFYKPIWTEEIHQEWIRNLLKKRKDLSYEQLLKTKNAMNMAFPDANVENYKNFIGKVFLPDKYDRHIVACALKSKSEIIITFNIKDFPQKSLLKFNIQVLHPDEFITNIINTDKENSLRAFLTQVRRLKNPPMKAVDVFEALNKCGVPKSVYKIKKFLNEK